MMEEKYCFERETKCDESFERQRGQAGKGRGYR